MSGELRFSRYLREHHYGDRNVDVPARYGLEAIRKSVQAKVAAAATDTHGDGQSGVPAEEPDDGTASAGPH